MRADAYSGFLTSKLYGERAVKASGIDWSIVRPSLLDGEGGFGVQWMRMMARWPVHFVPADARGRIAALDVGELGEAIASLCETKGRRDFSEVELGGFALRTMAEPLAALRNMYGYAPILFAYRYPRGLQDGQPAPVIYCTSRLSRSVISSCCDETTSHALIFCPIYLGGVRRRLDLKNTANRPENRRLKPRISGLRTDDEEHFSAEGRHRRFAPLC